MNKRKFTLGKKYCDFNGHISEAGYLTVANVAIWNTFNAVGLSKIFSEENIGPIIFDTHMHFNTEVMEGEEVTVHFRAKISKDNKKIFREIDIINKKDQCAVKIISNGAFLDLEKRKVISASDNIIAKFKKYLCK